MSVTPSLLCASESSQLVIIDVQSRLAAAMSPAERERVIKNCGVLAQAAKLLSIPVCTTEQYPKGLGHTEPTLLEHLADTPAPLCKTCFAAAGAGQFNNQLDAHHGRHQIVLTGMETHVCVLQTALELQARGYQVFVVEDAVCSRSEANKHNALARLRQAGVVVSNTESVLFEWLRDAAHPQFKTLSALIK